jgi:hypothetical protein
MPMRLKAGTVQEDAVSSMVHRARTLLGVALALAAVVQRLDIATLSDSGEEGLPRYMLYSTSAEQIALLWLFSTLRGGSQKFFWNYAE